MSHILDRPAWNSLHNAHAVLGEGGSLAKRYPPSIVPFAAVADNTAESLQALTELAKPSEIMTLVEAGPVVIPEGFSITIEGILIQMAADRPHERIADPRIEKLGEADAEEMLALAVLTKPGPFTLGAQKLGPFWGIKVDGKIVAMAGQRLHVPGFTELSGLCTHPEFQGRGFGALLFRFVAGEIAASGETAFLHAFWTNTPAITLYKKLGFSIRAEMNLRGIKREG
jgi:predicted GNAT family acetyltransferase